MFQYTEFSKLYFQLFSSILSIACIKKDNNCIKIIDYFVNQYKAQNDQPQYDYESIVESLNIFLAQEIMENRNYLFNIHKRIGDKKYNELFGKNINYYRIGQKLMNNKYYYFQLLLVWSSQK